MAEGSQATLCIAKTAAMVEEAILEARVRFARTPAGCAANREVLF